MNKKFLVLVGVLALVIVIGGASYKAFRLVPAAAPVAPALQQTPPKALSQLPITQIFCQDVGPVGPLNGSGQWPPLIVHFPPQAGLAITQLTCQNPPDNLVVRINGLIRYRSPRWDLPNNDHSFRVEPAIIVPPGATLEIGLASLPAFNAQTSVTLSGYQLTTSDFGQ